MNVRAPPQPASLSKFDTYTSWPGGVDPSTPLFRTDNQVGGRKASRKAGRKAGRKNRKASRKNRKASRKSRR